MKEGGFVFSFVGSYKPVTIFLGLCQRCGRSWLEEEERTEAVLVFLSTRHLRRNSVTHLKPSK